MFLKLFALILFPIKDFLSSSRCKMTGKFSVFVYVSMSILNFFSILHSFSCFIHSIQIMCYFKMKVFLTKLKTEETKKSSFSEPIVLQVLTLRIFMFFIFVAIKFINYKALNLHHYFKIILTKYQYVT